MSQTVYQFGHPRPNVVSPFSWYGVRNLVAEQVWLHLGNPTLYVEPFCGTCSVLLARPNPRGREIVNDLSPWLVNFWRAMRSEPDRMARIYFQHLTNLNNRHLARLKVLLREKKQWITTNLADPQWHTVTVAAHWYIGQRNTFWGKFMVGNRRPQLKMGRKYRHPFFEHKQDRERIQARLQEVEIYHGDWTGVLHHLDDSSNAAVFLDSPYDDICRRNADHYEVELRPELAQEVALWGVAHAGPQLKVAMCGWEGDYDLPPDWPSIWGGATDGRMAHLDRIWFSA